MPTVFEGMDKRANMSIRGLSGKATLDMSLAQLVSINGNKRVHTTFRQTRGTQVAMRLRPVLTGAGWRRTGTSVLEVEECGARSDIVEILVMGISTCRDCRLKED